MHIDIDTIEMSRTARSDKTLTAALKRSIKQLHNYYTGKILQTKNYKIRLFNAIPRTLKDAKFTANGSA